MKRTTLIILCFIFVFTFCSCGIGNKTEYTSQTKEDYRPSQNYTFTESDAETAALKALYQELSNLKYPIFDVEQTRYSIGSIKRDVRAAGTVYHVYGTYTLYDKYGDFVSGYVGEKFSVTVYTNGRAVCKLE